MDLKELHRRVFIGIDKYPSASSPSFLRDEIDVFINDAIEFVIKTKLLGYNNRGASFQSDQKSSDDMRMLIKTTKYSAGVDPDDNDSVGELVNEGNAYYAAYPSGYMFGVGEAVVVSSESAKCWPKDANGDPIKKRTDVIESTIENMDSRLSNSLSDHVYSGLTPKPIRVYSGNRVELYTDGQYQIDEYILTYIKKPEKLTWSDLVEDHEMPINIFPDHVWTEVVNIAVRSALENISEPRYQSYSMVNSAND